MNRSYTVKLYPNAHMQLYLKQCVDYRRCIWNKALALWNHEWLIYKNAIDMIPNPTKQQRQIINSIYPRPKYYQIRRKINDNKQTWQFKYPSDLIDTTVRDLAHAFAAFQHKVQSDTQAPKFKSRRDNRQCFKSMGARINDNKLILVKGSKWPISEFYPIRFRGLPHKLNDTQPCLITIWPDNGKYFATLTFKDINSHVQIKANRKTAIDLNVKHFDYYEKYRINQFDVLPKRLERLYNKNKILHQQINRRYSNSKRCQQAKTKLLKNYRKIKNIQNDLYHKFTTYLVQYNKTLVIEDLHVKNLMMSHVASKGLHRAAFNRFRRLLTYKCIAANRNLIVANQFYPSTQICHACGYRKTGDEKITLRGNALDGTNHQQYRCNNPKCKLFHVIQDRDANAVKNLLNLTK